MKSLLTLNFKISLLIYLRNDLIKNVFNSEWLILIGVRSPPVMWFGPSSYSFRSGAFVCLVHSSRGCPFQVGLVTFALNNSLFLVF